ncbi:hypothetical protein BCY88_38690 [Paraburkholderia fungorum]|uniref:Uncharacterized protein n=1 Tax=Paraburkholderia fungorum TaxID=134537 RepID=A0A3R7HK15_9BURK|nr:hypothetical protein BCY88_38690 [Paraburkholderia fungorum]
MKNERSLYHAHRFPVALAILNARKLSYWASVRFGSTSRLCDTCCALIGITESASHSEQFTFVAP